jgi:hypothetical protein
MEVSQKSFARKKPDQLVYLELGSGNGGMLLSISEDGFRFRAVSPLRPNGLMPFAFSIDGSRRLQGIGEVEWLDDDGKSGGMRFVEVSPDFRSILHQWLALDSHQPRPSREVTPAAATPLDTMEKIREELRRGHSGSPSPQPERRDVKLEAPAAASPKREAASQKLEPPSGPRQHGGASLGSSEQSEGPAFASHVAERKRETADWRNASAPPVSDRQTAETSPAGSAPARSEPARNNRDRPLERVPQAFSRPPFTHSAESETPAPTEQAGSAFLKKLVPQVPSASYSQVQPPAVPNAPELTRSAADEAVSTEALRRPFRATSSSANQQRPYIPLVDESFETAWERARLSAPPESPHLSRAAAGSIIGIALAVILGALAFNFRQDIGELVIDVGQRISGDHRPAAAPSTTPSENKTESQSAPDATGSQPSTAPNKLDTPSGSVNAPNRNGGNASDPQVTHGANSGAAHETAADVARDAASSAKHNPTASPSSTVAKGANNPAASSTSSPMAPIPGESSQNPGIGSEPGSGQDEFNAARELLRGDHRQRDLSKALDLLWAGVRKGYVPAEVTLADLYRRGDGVPKNCDQAQVLLVAASKKGSPEARHLLEQMAETGCSE